MKHVTVEFTSPTSYRLIVDGVMTSYTCKLILLPGKDSKKPEYINPTHNEAWSRMLEASNG